MCTHHAHCADGHQDYEGKLYYNKYWKRDNPNIPEWMSNKIEKFINKNNMMSIQEVARYPIMLTTRCYCKHRFIEVNTIDALTGYNFTDRFSWTYYRKKKTTKL